MPEKRRGRISVGLYKDVSFDKSSAVAEMGDRARATWAEKCGGGLLCPFPWGELGPHLTQCGLGRSLPLYQVASLSIQPSSLI